MQSRLDAFLPEIPELASKTSAELIDYFVYFLTVITDSESATPKDVDACFALARIQAYSNVAAYLSRHAARGRGKTPKFVKAKKGYQLERNTQLDLQKTLRSGPARIETSHLMRRLLPQVTDSGEQAFLQEAVDCYEIGARRAAIVMMWLLTMHHLQSYVFKCHLPSFNIELAKNKDKRIKVASISVADDFADVPEGKFIELCRSARIITNDVRKILDTKLGIRNSSAHPSSVSISEIKATDFVVDLVDNIILKYPL